MKKSIFKSFFCILVFLTMTGCMSKKYNIHQRYDYEGVYKPKTEIVVDGVALDRSRDKERVWIISDATLTFLLDQAKQSVK